MTGLDTALLLGASFTCRPGCALCCYTTPRVTDKERAQLIAIRPGPIASADGSWIPSWPAGGACQMLHLQRCTVHAQRPSPCRQFPISVHLGARAQATLVVSCPGLTQSPFQLAPGGQAPVGLEGELAAAHRSVETLSPAEADRIERRWNAAVRRAGLTESTLLELRERLRSGETRWENDEWSDPGLPSEEAGLEHLPLFHDEQLGRVALAASGERVAMLVLREQGGVDRRFELELPDQPPQLNEEAVALEAEYRRLWLERDGFAGAALLRANDEGRRPLEEVLLEDLFEVLGAARARAFWRERLAGRSGVTLSRDALAAGIAATDADYLDRPTVGAWL